MSEPSMKAQRPTLSIYLSILTKLSKLSKLSNRSSIHSENGSKSPLVNIKETRCRDCQLLKPKHIFTKYGLIVQACESHGVIFCTGQTVRRNYGSRCQEFILKIKKPATLPEASDYKLEDETLVLNLSQFAESLNKGRTARP